MAVVAPRITIEIYSIIDMSISQGVRDSLNSVLGEMAKRAKYNICSFITG